MDQVTDVLTKIKRAGIDLDTVTQKLEDEGIEKFNAPFKKMLQAIDEQIKK